MLPNLGTTGSQLEEHRFSVLGTSDSKSWNQSFPIMEPRVPSSNRWWSAKAVTNASQSWNHGFPARGTAGFPSIRTNAAQPWNHGFPVLGTSHSKSWNQSFPILEPRVPSSNNWWWSAKVVTTMLPNLGTTGSQLEELLVPNRSNQCFPTLEPRVPSSRNERFPNVGTYIYPSQSCSQAFEPMLPNLGTYASQSWNHGFPARGTDGPNVGTNAPQAWNYVFRVLGIAGCFQAWNHGFRVPETVYLTCKNLYTCFQGWKLCFAAWHVFNFQELRPACVCAKQGVYWTDMHIKKLDDGWPESVKEQSLLVLVWKHYIRRQYIKDVKIGRREE